MANRSSAARAGQAVLVAAVIVLGARDASGVWVVDEHGQCVRAWTAGSLARGPTAIANAPLLPFRSAVGGVRLAREDRMPGVQKKILLPPLLAVAGGMMGLVESVIWVGTGLADTITGGYFEVPSDEATQLGITPVRPLFASAARAPTASAQDPCGRRQSRLERIPATRSG